MMAAAGRPRHTLHTVLELEGRGGLRKYPLLGPPVMLYGCDERDDVPSFDGWAVWRGPAPGWYSAERRADGTRPSPFDGFRRILDDADPDHELVFFENDLAPCINAVPRIGMVELPPRALCASFFDFRQAFPSPGLWTYPPGLPLHGAQCLKINARHLRALRELARGYTGTAWDVFMSDAARALGLELLQYVPSLVQHTGTTSSTFAPGGRRPIAPNFPGIDFDALRDEAPDPVVQGFCPEVQASNYCTLHDTEHELAGQCPALTLEPAAMRTQRCGCKIFERNVDGFCMCHHGPSTHPELGACGAAPV